MCDIGEGGQEGIWEIWCAMEGNTKLYFSKQCLRRDTCPNQTLMGSNAFVRGVMNLEALQCAVERF